MTDTPAAGDLSMRCKKCGLVHAQCAAHNRAGEPCGARARKGQRVCRMHGGSTPAALEAGAERVRQAEGAKLVGRLFDNPDAEPVTDPVAHAQRLLGRIEYTMTTLGAWLNSVTEGDGRVGGLDPVHLAAYTQVLREGRRLSTDLARLGLESRLVAVEESQAVVLAAVVKRILDRLDLSDAQRIASGGIVRDEFLALEAGGNV